MKKRIDFVTNSSSSSFIINKKNLTEKQIKQILNYKTNAKKVFPDIRNIEYDINPEWKIYEAIRDGVEYIIGVTSMDNFDMRTYLTRIGVKEEYVENIYYS